MRARDRSLLLLLACAAGCHTTDTLPAPDLDGAPSALLIEVRGETVGFVHALDAADPNPPSFRRSGPSRLYLLRYPCGLDVLGIEAGPQTLLREPRARLDLPAAADVLTFDLDTSEAWQISAEAPEAVQDVLLRLEVPEDNLCRSGKATLEAMDVQLSVSDTRDLLSPTYAVPLEGGATLVGALFTPDIVRTTTTGHGAYRVLGDSIEPVPEVVQLGPIMAGLRLDDGDLFLMGPENLYLGHPERGFSVVTSTSFSITPRRVVLSGSPSGDELFLAASADLEGPLGQFGSRRWLFELSADGWQRVAGVDLDQGSASSIDVAWLGPRRAIAVGLNPGGDEVLWIESGAEVGRDRVDLSLSHAQRMPDGRALVANFHGKAYRYDGATWADVRQGPANISIGWVHAMNPGYVFFGSAGNFRISQTIDGIGDCGVSILGGGRLARLAPVGAERWLAVLSSLGPGALRVARVALTDGPKPVCR